jgi:hypothetical protein
MDRCGTYAEPPPVGGEKVLACHGHGGTWGPGKRSALKPYCPVVDRVCVPAGELAAISRQARGGHRGIFRVERSNETRVQSFFCLCPPFPPAPCVPLAGAGRSAPARLHTGSGPGSRSVRLVGLLLGISQSEMLSWVAWRRGVVVEGGLGTIRGTMWDGGVWCCSASSV